ncbi:hypothetical protein HED60_23915 [Planctomycetales bacterium ZRK34]|nr:hypothetical protein HED60_23915 [Planctomycetales bacterium ZRK34]
MLIRCRFKEMALGILPTGRYLGGWNPDKCCRDQCQEGFVGWLQELIDPQFVDVGILNVITPPRQNPALSIVRRAVATCRIHHHEDQVIAPFHQEENLEGRGTFREILTPKNQGG